MPSIRPESSSAPDDKGWVDPYASGNGAPLDARPETTRRLLALAYILAFAVPPLGFGLGVLITVRFKDLRRHGPWIIAISILASAIWVLVFASGALTNTTTQGY